MVDITKTVVPSRWHRLSTRKRGPQLVPPDTGQKMLGLPDGWPQPSLPLWRRLEYRDKLPLPSWPEWELTTGKAAMGFTPKWQGAEFDTWDPEAHLYDLEYYPLNDRALWRFCNTPSRKKILRHHGLITADGKVRVSLKVYNQWRRDMFRQQLQLRNKKLKMAERNQLCGMIKGFIDAIYDIPSAATKQSDDIPANLAEVATIPTEEKVADKSQPRTKSLKSAKVKASKPKRSGVSDHLKLGPTSQYEITDEMANPRFDSKEETDALLVELIRLHGFTHQIRREIAIYNRITVKAQTAIKSKHVRDHLLAKIKVKDKATVTRRHHLAVEVTADDKRRQQARDLKRRITYQNVMEKLDKAMFETAEKQSAMWKNFFCRKHRQSEPTVPSGRSFEERYRSRLILEQEKRTGMAVGPRSRKAKAITSEQPHKDVHAHEKDPAHIKIHGHPHPEKSGHNDSHWFGYATHDQPREAESSYEEHPHKNVHAHEKDPQHLRVYGHPHPEKSGHNDSHWLGHSGRDQTLSPMTVSSHIDLSHESPPDKPPRAHHHTHQSQQPDDVQSDGEFELLIPAGHGRGITTASSYFDAGSSDSLSDKPSALGHSQRHHRDRSLSPQDEAPVKSRPQQFATKTGHLDVASIESLSEKSSTVEHSRPSHRSPSPQPKSVESKPVIIQASNASGHLNVPSTESLSKKSSTLGHARPDPHSRSPSPLQKSLEIKPIVTQTSKTSGLLDVASTDSLSEKSSTVGHSHRHHPERLPSPQEELSDKINATFQPRDVTKDHSDAISDNGLSDKSSPILGRSHDRFPSPAELPSNETPIELKTEKTEAELGRLVVPSNESLAEKSSTLGHSHPRHRSLPAAPDVASQSSFEYSTEEKEQGHENSEERKMLRPLKSALSKPGGRAESQHMKITFAPEVADDPDVPTAKRSSEVLLDDNVPSNRDILSHHLDTTTGINQQDSIPVDVPLRAAASMTSMPILADSTASDVREDNAPEYHPHYITADDHHRRRPHTPPNRSRSRKEKGRADRSPDRSVNQTATETQAKPLVKIATESHHHRIPQDVQKVSLDEAAIEAMAVRMFTGDLDDDHHISAGAHHTKRHSPSSHIESALSSEDRDVKPTSDAVLTGKSSRKSATEGIPQEQVSPAMPIPIPVVPVDLQSVTESESSVDESEMARETDQIIGPGGVHRQQALEIVNEIHEAASAIQMADSRDQELTEKLNPEDQGHKPEI